MACGRAGINIMASSDGVFHVGSPESSPASDSDITFQFPSHPLSSAQDDSPRFLPVSDADERIMKEAALKDLVKIFGLEVI